MNGDLRGRESRDRFQQVVGKPLLVTPSLKIFSMSCLDQPLSDCAAWIQVSVGIFGSGLAILLGYILVELFKKLQNASTKSKYLAGVLLAAIISGCLVLFLEEIGLLIVLLCTFIGTLMLLVSLWKSL